jgi:hypothetical protein
MFSKMKTAERELARIIRRDEGAPIKEIARRVGAAPSSVSRWVRDIRLTPAQEQELLRRNPAYNGQLSGTTKQAANRRAERIAYQQAGRQDKEIKTTCNLFADHIERQDEIEQFWLDVAQLSKRSLCKSYVNVYSKHSKKKRTNRLPYGTVRVTVCRTRVVQSIFGSIQEYAGFEREAWLE